MNNQSKKTQQTKEILEKSGVEIIIKQFPDSTRTAQEAASAIGCEVSQIAKSLIFKSKDSGKPILVIAGGSNRVDLKKVEDLLKESVEKADADFVLEQTGFVIGGVPPFGHATSITPFIDEDLFQHKEIWASAGTPHSVFKLTPENLTEISNGKVVDIKLIN